MLPVIAIVGRPNVGKSTLFNRLTGSRDALVFDEPGVTRDRQYGFGYHEKQAFIVLDTGGIEDPAFKSHLNEHIQEQVSRALEEADVVIFLVDAQQGLAPDDHYLAKQLRKLNKPVIVTVNKTDGVDEQTACDDFFAFGFKEAPQAISAINNRGMKALLALTFSYIDVEALADSAAPVYSGIQLAVIGRPNVGKSTLVNRLLGEDRVVTYDEAGTTRDSIYIPLERDGEHYVIIDTAGVRRRSKVTQGLEKFSVLKTLQALDAAQVVIMVIDASEGILKQDMSLLDMVIASGKALIIAVNKWDCLSHGEKQRLRKDWVYDLRFANFAKIKSISALHGSGVGDLFQDIRQAYHNAMQALSTSELTRVLQRAVASQAPPQIGQRRIKLRYAHQGGKNPPIIVIHGNQTEKLPKRYYNYLTNFFRQAFDFSGTPVKLRFISSQNPYQHKKNPK